MSEDIKATQRFPRWLILVAAMTGVGPVSIDMYLPGFPAIQHELGSRGVETTMAAYLVGIAVGQLFYGPLSDRFGRKPPLYVGFVLYVLGALGCALASSMPMLIVMRVVQALGGCAGIVVGRAIVRDRCEPHEAARVFTMLMMIFALGPVLAPALGGVIVTAFGWRATFVFQCVFGLVLLFAMHSMLRESLDTSTAPRLSITSIGRAYLRLAADRRLVGYSLLGGFGFGAMFSYVTGAPIVLTQRYGLSPQQFGGLIGLNGLAFMAASRLNMSSLRSLGPQEVLARYVWVPPVIGIALSSLALLWDLPLWVLVTLQLSFFVSIGRVNPNVVALALAPHGRDAGTASALMGALQSMLATIAGLAVAVCNDGTIGTLTSLMAAGAILAWISYLWAKKQG